MVIFDVPLRIKVVILKEGERQPVPNHPERRKRGPMRPIDNRLAPGVVGHPLTNGSRACKRSPLCVGGRISADRYKACGFELHIVSCV
jgi:hypothetical protein